jgi:hypothetical protein
MYGNVRFCPLKGKMQNEANVPVGAQSRTTHPLPFFVSLRPLRAFVSNAAALIDDQMHRFSARLAEMQNEPNRGATERTTATPLLDGLVMDKTILRCFAPRMGKCSCWTTG